MGIDMALEPPLPKAQVAPHARPEICGICNEPKIKLATTTRDGREVWLCPNTPEGAKMPCDGQAYRHYVRNYGDLAP